MNKLTTVVSNFLILFLILFSINGLSQNITITDDNGYSADNSAMLDVKSTTKGMLIPRVDSSQRNAISSPATGLLVFDTSINAFYYYNGTKWQNLSSVVKSDSTETINDALFSVVNGKGDTVFAVYSESVEIQIGDGIAKGTRGGFAVGGLSSGGKLNPPPTYLSISKDKARIYVDTATAKGTKGGFAVGGLSSTGKVLDVNYLMVSDDSVRVYVDTTSLAKGTKGGFAVGGLSSTGKGNPVKFMDLTPKNYFIGHQSGLKTTGLYNSFFGFQTGLKNTIGNNNVFLGYKAGYSNTTGSNEVFLRIQSGYGNSTGALNVFLGNYAGQQNTLYGSQVCRELKGGFGNIMLGYNAGSSLINGNVGISVAPTTKLDINGNSIRIRNSNLLASSSDDGYTGEFR